MTRVIWLDDEAPLLKRYALDLELRGHSVKLVDSLDAAVEELRNDIYDLMILDNMMEPAPFFTEMETMGGRRTGIFFAQYVRLHFPYLSIIVFSMHIPTAYDEAILFGNGIRFFRKQDYAGPSVSKLIDQVPEFEVAPRAIDAVDLKPGMFGLTIDVRKFIIYLKSKIDANK